MRKTANPTRLGSLLQERRQAMGLTSEEAARALGLTRPGWAFFENGKGALSPKHVAQVATLLGIPEPILVAFAAQDYITRRFKTYTSRLRAG